MAKIYTFDVTKTKGPMAYKLAFEQAKEIVNNPINIRNATLNLLSLKLQNKGQFPLKWDLNGSDDSQDAS